MCEGDAGDDDDCVDKAVHERDVMTEQWFGDRVTSLSADLNIGVA